MIFVFKSPSYKSIIPNGMPQFDGRRMWSALLSVSCDRRFPRLLPPPADVIGRGEPSAVCTASAAQHYYGMSARQREPVSPESGQQNQYT